MLEHQGRPGSIKKDAQPFPKLSLNMHNPFQNCRFGLSRRGCKVHDISANLITRLIIFSQRKYKNSHGKDINRPVNKAVEGKDWG